MTYFRPWPALRLVLWCSVALGGTRSASARGEAPDGSTVAQGGTRSASARGDTPDGSTVAFAVVGDSLSTGAVTHPALAFDGKVLWDIFSGATPVPVRSADLPPELAARLPDPLLPPQRLWPTSREFFGGPDWVWRNSLQSISRTYLDTAQYSWSYLVGRQLGVPPAAIAIAGEDGARMGNLSRHLDRVLNENMGLMPKRLVIFYTGNDLCGTSLADTTPAAEFGGDLERGLSYMLRNAKAAPGGSEVYVVSYMGILQLLTSESILAKKVRAFGGETTCRELRANAFRPTPAQAEALRAKPLALDKAASVEAWYFSLVMPPNPAAFCTTLFGETTSKEREAEVQAMANRIRAYRDQEQRVTQRFNTAEANAAGFHLHLLTKSAEVVFTGDDIAQDCFHLSVLGQAKIAQAILTDIQAVEKAAH